MWFSEGRGAGAQETWLQRKLGREYLVPWEHPWCWQKASLPTVQAGEAYSHQDASKTLKLQCDLQETGKTLE